jgi:hypothetical protein
VFNRYSHRMFNLVDPETPIFSNGRFKDLRGGL